MNLAIHVLAAWTLFGRRAADAPPAAAARNGSARPPRRWPWSSALLWMIHPLQTESVTYVIQRTEALVGLFYLLDALLRHSRGNLEHGRNTVVRCGHGGVPAGHGHQGSDGHRAADRAALRPHVSGRLVSRGLAATIRLVLWPWPPPGAWSCRLLISTGFYGGTTGFAVQKFTWWSYLLTQPGVIVHYLRLAFWPSGLCFDYGWPPAARRAAKFVLPGILVVGLLGSDGLGVGEAAGMGISRRLVLRDPCADVEFRAHPGRGVRASHVSVAGGGGRRRGDRRLASPASGLSAAGRFRAPALQVMGGVSGDVLAALHLESSPSSATRITGAILSIWEDTVAKAPGNARAHNNLGVALADRGRIDEAIAQYQKALEIKPDYAEAHNNLGLALAESRTARRGHRPLPEGAGNQARLRRGPQQPRPRPGQRRPARRGHRPLPEGIGNQARLRRGPQQSWLGSGESRPDRRGRSPSTARRWNSSPTTRRPTTTSALPWPTLRTARRGHRPLPQGAGNQARLRRGPQQPRPGSGPCGRVDEAIAHYRKALEIKPDYADAHNNLGSALAGTAGSTRRSSSTSKALEIKPDFAEAHNNLGTALAGCRRVDEAIAHYQKALEIKPEYADAHNNLGLALAMRGRFDEAIAHCRKALEIEPDFAEAYNSLAIALAGSGHANEAVKAAEQALALATSQNNVALADTLRTRIKLYQAGSPYHETQQPSLPASSHP